MSSQRAAASPETRRFDAAVERVDGREVVLDRTYFYAESGGQPADRGTVGGIPVEDVQPRDGAIVHTLSEPPSVEVGSTTSCTIDDAFRTYCMRAHTASHALYGAGRRLLSNLGYGGFNIDAEKVRVDFETSTDVDDAVLVELERLVNRVVWESRPVAWEHLPVEEARDRDRVAFNTKTEEGVMDDADAVRVVTIGGDDEPWDVAACGGTHVSNTREIGPVEVLGRSNPGEGLTRVEFAVGPVGIDRRAAVHGAALEAAAAAGTNVDDLPTAVARLTGERDDLRAELDALRSEVLRNRLAEADSFERDELTWQVSSIGAFDPNEVGEAIKPLAGDAADVVAVVGEGSAPFVVVASGGERAAAAVVDEVTDEFGGGGGGGPTFAQGGGLDAPPADVVSYLRGGRDSE
ncbi:alanyl-tRNA editing protein [Haloferacaceae archaeon DSL9]